MLSPCRTFSLCLFLALPRSATLKSKEGLGHLFLHYCKTTSDHLDLSESCKYECSECFKCIIDNGERHLVLTFLQRNKCLTAKWFFMVLLTHTRIWFCCSLHAGPSMSWSADEQLRQECTSLGFAHVTLLKCVGMYISMRGVIKAKFSVFFFSFFLRFWQFWSVRSCFKTCSSGASGCISPEHAHYIYYDM